MNTFNGKTFLYLKENSRENGQSYTIVRRQFLFFTYSFRDPIVDR